VSFGDLPGYAGILGFVIALGTLLGVSLRAGRQTSTINNYREAASSWEMKANAQEGQIKDLNAQVLDLQKENAALHSEVATLKDLVTGRAALTEVTAQLSVAVNGIENLVTTQASFARWQDEIRARIDALEAHLRTAVQARTEQQQ